MQSLLLNYAKENEYILFTNDLDFGALLAANKNISPSVIQVRTQDVLPLAIGELVINSLKQYENLLENGALISIDESKERARILPLKN
jgi:predicted nuclease of predicted toxin-antitoxin system